MPRFFEESACELALGRGAIYHHWFGGPSIVFAGVVPAGRAHPVHLLYDLDLRDPALGIGKLFPGQSRFPILNALQYNCAAIIYRLIDDSTVEILNLEGTDDPSHPTFSFANNTWDADFPFDNYPREFPRTEVIAVPLDPSLVNLQTKLVAPNGDEGKDLTPNEYKRYREPLVQIGGRQQMWQGIPEWSCGTDECLGLDAHNNGKEVLAVIWECPVPGLHIWDPEGTELDVGSAQIILSRCTGCNVLHSCNRCD